MCPGSRRKWASGRAHASPRLFEPPVDPQRSHREVPQTLRSNCCCRVYNFCFTPCFVFLLLILILFAFPCSSSLLTLTYIPYHFFATVSFPVFFLSPLLFSAVHFYFLLTSALSLLFWFIRWASEAAQYPENRSIFFFWPLGKKTRPIERTSMHGHSGHEYPLYSTEHFPPSHITYVQLHLLNFQCTPPCKMLISQRRTNTALFYPLWL